jgi:hypothetical protein
VIGPELARHILVTPIGTKRHPRRG